MNYLNEIKKLEKEIAELKEKMHHFGKYKFQLYGKRLGSRKEWHYKESWKSITTDIHSYIHWGYGIRFYDKNDNLIYDFGGISWENYEEEDYVRAVSKIARCIKKVLVAYENKDNEL